jgi:hypothetical protein
MRFTPRFLCIRTARANGEWCAEHFDTAGGCYVTSFAGPEAERCAGLFRRALKTGAVKIIREGTMEP